MYKKNYPSRHFIKLHNILNKMLIKVDPSFLLKNKIENK